MVNEEGKIWYGIALDVEKLRADVEKAKKELARIGSTAESESLRMDSAFKKAATAIGVSLAGVSVAGFIKKMFQVRSEFQDTESSMRVFLGSADQAAKFMKELQDYAWYNMFEFSDLTKESSKLLAFGNDVNSVIPILDKLSNIAAGTKQPLSEFVDLYNKAKSIGSVDARGLESWGAKGVVITDVLKEMGVEVDRSSIKFEHLEMVLNKVTSEGGRFHKLMGEQMQNLSASLGQLQDDLSIMFNELGQKMEKPMKSAIELGSFLVDNYEKIGRVIAGLITTYGAYRAALIVVTTLQGLHATQLRLIAISGKQVSLAQVAMATTTKGLASAMASLNKTVLANPYVLLATAFVGLAAAIWAFRDSTTAAEKAQKRHNERLKEAKERKDGFLSTTSQLIGVINDETQAIEEQIIKYKELQEVIPEIEGMTIKEFKGLGRKEQNRLIAESQQKREEEEFNKLLEDTRKNIAEMEQELHRIENAPMLPEMYPALKQASDTLKGNIKDNRENLKLLEAEKEEREKIAQKVKGAKEDYEDINDIIEKTKKNIESLEQKITNLRSGNEESINIAEDLGDLEKKLKDEQSKLDLLLGVNQKEINDTLKAREDLNKKILDLDVSLQQSRIDIMEDGREKALAELDLRHKQELAKITQEQKDIEEEYRKAGKGGLTGTDIAGFDERMRNAVTAYQDSINQINDKYSNELADVYKRLGDVFLSEEERKQTAIKKTYDDLREWAEKSHKAGDFDETKYINLIGEIDKAELYESLKDSIEQFRDYEQKREDIVAEYNDKIVKLRKAGYEREAEEAEKQKNIVLSNLERTQIEESGFWIKLFDNFTKTSTSELTELFNLAEEEIKNATQLSIEDLGILQKRLNEIRQELARRNPFEYLLKSYKEYRDAVKSGNKDKAGDTWAMFEAASESTKTAVSEMGGALSGLADVFSNKLADGLEKTVSLINNGVTAFQAFGKSGEKSAGDTVKGMQGIIGIITTVIGVVVDSLDDTAENAKRNAELTRQQRGYWESINFQVERYTKMLEQISGADYFSTINKTIETLEAGIERSKKAILEFRNGEVNGMEFALFDIYVHQGDHGYIWDRYGNEKTEKLLNDAHEIYDLIKDLDEESLMALRNNAALWSQIPDWMQEAIKQTLDYYDQLEKLREQLSKDLLQTTSSDMENAILDWLKAGEQGIDKMGDYFEKVMRDALLQSFVIEQLRPKIKDFYDRYKEYADSNQDGRLDLDQNEISALNEEWKELLSWAQTETNALTSILGEINTSNREASAKGFASMSQDTGNELNGRFTAIQAHTFEINENLKYLISSKGINVGNIEADAIRMDIRNGVNMLTVNSERVLNHLAGIENNTAFCRRLDGMDEDLRAVKSSLDDINLKGIRLRQ